MLSVIILSILSLSGWILFIISHKKQKEQKKYPPLVLTEWDIQCMAIHEAGHAVCSYYLPEREKLIRITISPNDEAFGMVKTELRMHHNETEISFLSRIATLLGGPIAEEYFLHSKTSSGIHDFATARSIAVDMVTKFGMGEKLKKLAPVSVYDNSYCLFSEHIKMQIDEDIVDIIEKASSIAMKNIEEHAEEIQHLAKILLVKKTLEVADIEHFFHNEKYSSKL